MRFIARLALAAFALAGAASANAATITYSYHRDLPLGTYQYRSGFWFTDSFSQFDPSLGTLLSVTASATGSYSYHTEWDATNGISGNIIPYGRFYVRDYIDRPLSLGMDVGDEQLRPGSVSPGEVGSFDGAKTFTNQAVITPVQQYYGSFANFIGTGTLRQNLDGEFWLYPEWDMGGPGYYHVTGSGSVDYSLTYQYVPAGVPEPVSWELMIGGFGLAGAMMRRRKVTIAFA